MHGAWRAIAQTIRDACMFTWLHILFHGHVLRMNENVPARQAMVWYFDDKSHKGRQGNFCTIASVISDEYKVVFQKSIKTK